MGRLAPEPKSSEPESVEGAASSGGAAFAQAGGVLLGELESSLQASQHDLLSRNLAGIEQRTGEQIRLRRALKILWSRNPLQSSDPMPFDRAGAAKLLLTQLRVLHLGRVQAALLMRAQRRSRMLSHVLAGPGAGYAAPAVDRALPSPAWSSAGRRTHCAS